MNGRETVELKPCPFCGGQAFAWASGSEQNVSCPKCYCRTDNYGPGEVARAAAIAAWNTRAALGDMTSEPRPAVEVWWAAYEEFMDPPPHVAFSKAAAAVIEADREEIRAPLQAEIERLREALREVFEEWAGSEGFIPETAPEGYLLHLTKRMADIARAALGETK